MKRVLIATIVLLLLALSPHLVSASAISAPQTVFAESCVSFQYTISVTNTNTDTRPYRVTLSDTEAASWIVLEPQNLVLQAGEQRNILVFGRAPCQIEGKYPLKMTISDGYDDYNIRQTIQVTREPNVAVTPEFTALQSCPCTLQQFPVTITNTRSYPEVYTLTTEDSKGFSTVQPNKLILFPGQSQTVRVAMQSSCEYYGEHDFTLVVETQNSGYTVRQPLTSVVNYCYDYTTTASQSIDACLDEVTIANITVTNDMHFTNTFTFEGSPSWVQPQFESVELPAGQSIVVPTVLIPQSEYSAGSRGLQEGAVTASVTVNSELGKASATVPFTTNLRQCRGLFVEAPQEVTICPDDNTIPFTINNFGSEPSQVEFSLAGPSAFSLESGMLELDGPSAKELELAIDHDLLEEGTYELEITAQQQGNELIVDSQTIDLEVIDLVSCYQIEFTPKRLTVEVGPQNHTLTATNIGVKEATYTLALNGTEWMNLGVSEVTLPAQTQQTITITTNAPEGVSTVDTSLVAGANGVAYVTQLTFLSSRGLLFVFLLALAIIILIILILLLLLLLRRMKGSKGKKKAKSKSAKKTDAAAIDKKKERAAKKKAKKRAKEKKKAAKALAKQKKKDARKKKKADKKAKRQEKKKLKLLAKKQKQKAKADKKAAKAKKKEERKKAKEKQKLEKIKALSNKEKFKEQLAEEKTKLREEKKRHKEEMKTLAASLRSKKSTAKKEKPVETITPVPVDDQDKLFADEGVVEKSSTKKKKTASKSKEEKEKRKMIWWPLWLLLLLLLILLLFWAELGSSPLVGTNETQVPDNVTQILENSTVPDPGAETLPETNTTQDDLKTNETVSLLDRIKDFLNNNNETTNPNQDEQADDEDQLEGDDESEETRSIFDRLQDYFANPTQTDDQNNQENQDNQNNEQTDEQQQEDELLSPLSQRQLDIVLLQQTVESLPEQLRNSVQYQIITENEQTSVDLGELFSDPDGGVLEFSALPPQNISVDVDGSVITLRPDEGFIGARSTIFYAQDSDGQIAQSPIINILIVPEDLTAQAQRVRDQYPDVDTLIFDDLVDSTVEQEPISLLTDSQKTLVWIMTWVLIIGLIGLIVAVLFFSKAV